MSSHSKNRGGDKAAEENQNLWLLTVAPGLWAAHFLLSYVTAAIWCAKRAETGGSFAVVRVAIAVYTVLALAGIFANGWSGFRRQRLGAPEGSHDFDTREDRHRFLGFATLLLAGLSAVGVLFVAMAAVFIGGCD